MKIIELGENPFENGRILGKAFSAYLEGIKDEYTEKLSDPLILEHVHCGKDILEKEIPFLYQELLGKAEETGIEPDAVFLMAMPEILRRRSGCTTIIMRNKDGSVSFSHNEDETYAEFNPGNTALLKYCLKGKTIYGYANACKTIGSCFGFRSDGLLFSCNNIMSDEVNLSYGSRYLLSAKLYFSDSFEEAVRIAENMKPASSFHINLADIVNQKACSIERDIDDCTVTYLDDVLVHSNHFLHKEGKNDVDTLFRYEKSCELLKETPDPYTVLSYTCEEYDHSVRLIDPQNLGKGITVANMTYRPDDKTLTITDVIGDDIQTFSL